MSKNKQTVKLAYDKGYRVINGEVFSFTGNKLKCHKDNKGYLRFTFSSGSKYIYPLRVHWLVAYQKFKDTYLQSNLVVRHLNGNQSDNRESNIELGTISDNILDMSIEDRRKMTKKATEASLKKRSSCGCSSIG